MNDRFALWVTALLLTGAFSGVLAADQPLHQFDIKPQSLAAALLEFSQQAEQQVLSATEVVGALRSPGVSGRLTNREALEKLLGGTGLTFEIVDSQTVRIGAKARNQSALQSGAGATTSPRMGDPPVGDSSELVNTRGLEEIVVSAQKRGAERLLDVPIPIGVINADQISGQGQVLLRDYFSNTPGIVLTPGYDGAQAITIRGIGATGFDNPAVGITIDDVPFGSSTGAGSGWLVPDLDPGDLEQIEVLRGPQGTLYGSNSMGGLIRYVTKDPSMDTMSGRLQVGTSSVYNGSEPGFNLRGSVNVPVDDDFAVRASGFRSQVPGYIDEVLSGRKGVNDIESEGGRLAGMWKPNDSTSVKLTALYQTNQAFGTEEAVVGTGLGDLQENYIPNSGGSKQTIQSYAATVDIKAGPFNIKSITGYSDLRNTRTLDYTVGFGPLAAPLYTGADGSIYGEFEDISKLSQELRLTGDLTEHFGYAVGGFYTHERTAYSSYANAMNIETNRVIDPQFYYLYGPALTYDEYAGFANFTYRLTDSFEIEAGGRVTHFNFNSPVAFTGGVYAANYLGSNPYEAPAFSSHDSIGTYLFTPQFHVTKDVMIYSRFASGYRPGTANPPSPGIPSQSNPDQTRTYELGMKGQFLNDSLIIDTSIYHINWVNIQFATRDPSGVIPFETNGSGAKSDGVEISVSSKPRDGLSISAWFSYDDAILTHAFPAVAPAIGESGDRLPATARYSGSLSVDQEFPLPSGVVGFVGGVATYVGDRVGPFVDTEMRQVFPSYTKLDLHIGARVAPWEFTGYVTNAGDSRGILAGGIGYFNPAARQYITPRTIGASVTKNF